jgi:hypothetical protein
VRARYRAERQNQRNQHGSSSKRIGEERNRNIPAGQVIGHDAGANDGRQEEGCSERLSCSTPDHNTP